MLALQLGALLIGAAALVISAGAIRSSRSTVASEARFDPPRRWVICAVLAAAAVVAGLVGLSASLRDPVVSIGDRSVYCAPPAIGEDRLPRVAEDRCDAQDHDRSRQSLVASAVAFVGSAGVMAAGWAIAVGTRRGAIGGLARGVGPSGPDRETGAAAGLDSSRGRGVEDGFTS